jgi:hypothetical protein
VREIEVKEAEIYVTLVKKKLKNTMSDCDLVTAGYTSVVCDFKLCIKSSGSL